MENIIFKCSFCEKIYKRISDQHQHEKWCKENPNHLIKKSPAKSEKWLAAMQTRKHANQYTKAKELGLDKPIVSKDTREKLSKASKGRKHSEISKQKISESMRELIQNGNREYSFLHRKTYEFEGERLDSSYELLVAQELREHNIKFDIHPKGLNYIGDDGKIRTYFPDFYLKDYDVYLDPKNDFLLSEQYKYHNLTTKEKIMRVQDYNNISVIVLDKHSLTFDKIMECIKTVKLDIKPLNTYVKKHFPFLLEK